MKKYFIFLIFIYFTFQLEDVTGQAKVEKVDPSKIPAKISSFKSPFVPEFPDKDEFLTELFLGLQDQKSIDEPINIGKSLVFKKDFETIPLTKREGKIFREIEISSPNSNTMSVNFSHIELSKSGELFIINDEESYILGPIISEDVNRIKNFDPGFIPGDEIRILLVENENEGSISKVEISNIGHIIYDFFGVQKFETSKIEGTNCTGFGCSASCLQNIACFTNMNLESKAVALISYTDNSDPNFPGMVSLRGTGYLVNNGAQNKRALFLAMIHGIGGYMVPDLKFIFHYKSPQCTPTTTGSQMYFVQGATQLGLDASNDLRFLELSTNPGTTSVFTNNPVSYLGWSIINETIPTISGIHHPLGDVQKYMSGGPTTPFQLVEPGVNYGVWRYKVSNGFPETISSGSPTLNQQKRVIGSLYGAESPLNCSNFTTYNVYSVRLSRSWSLLCQYLDPNNEGIVAINTITSTPGSKIFPSVNGPNLVCSSSTFTLQNAPIDLSTSWSIIQGASLLSSPSSGTGKSALVSTLNSLVSGEVKIRFSISGLCTSKTYDKVFWVGKPATPIIHTLDVHMDFPPNRFTIYMNPPVIHGVTSYNWYLDGVMQSSHSSSATFNRRSPYCGRTYYVEVEAINACGTSVKGYYYVSEPSCFTGYSLRISPNPATSEVEIAVLGSPTDYGDKELVQQKVIVEQSGELVIYDRLGNQMHSQQMKSGKVTIDVQHLKPGTYVVKYFSNEGAVEGKLLKP
ncbi:T9SS type A sorting domain-containing protein [Algoriphagus halophytocola]|uniref:T9SS type A sorting domain-containing protein n=1 Tax=Algoriphagus halophytocola TaxID=2991499 RepID=A0ABY6ME95_9BACT|nr:MULTISPECIES: T9SS type A sorting domain-containing protein [unclassified Algoriphagus]UZD22118.1 T9SS type A sorting domain-containing protein [Algoriphagus sp. TR-M5]WBL43369.1 T9SS type A sorting domain-containing protein [Algoriphagus sp. TR-M9]